MIGKAVEALLLTLPPETSAAFADAMRKDAEDYMEELLEKAPYPLNVGLRKMVEDGPADATPEELADIATKAIEGVVALEEQAALPAAKKRNGK